MRSAKRSTRNTRSSTRRRASRRVFHWDSLTPRERSRCGTENPTSRTGRIWSKARPGTPCTKPTAWKPQSRWRGGSPRPGWAARWRSGRPKSTGDRDSFTRAGAAPTCLMAQSWSEHMAGKTSKPSAKVSKKVAVNRLTGTPRLLAGGNPQIAKADGDAPVQAYIAAMPGWKRDVGRRLDALIVRTSPSVHKAVKWNSPFYGVEGQGWFLNFHCFTNYVKVAFFRGTSLHPVPPGESKHKEVRYLDIHEDDELDEAQLAAWVRQASRLPGERM